MFSPRLALTVFAVLIVTGCDNVNGLRESISLSGLKRQDLEGRGAGGSVRLKRQDLESRGPSDMRRYKRQDLQGRGFGDPPSLSPQDRGAHGDYA